MLTNFTYTEYFHPNNGDPSTTTLPWLGYPMQVWLISALYLLIVLKIGPDFMKDRPAYKLQTTLFVYNSLQIVLNFIIGYNALRIQMQYRAYDMGCCRTLPVDHPHKSLEIWTSYAYFIMKIVDLFDTFVFVLRKSFKQITFLHVYHHVLMVNSVYTMLHFFGAGGELYVILVLNSFVHSVMYSYYLITAVSTYWRSIITHWKKYITLMQLMQFVIILVYNSLPLLFRWDCKPSKFDTFNVFQSLVMIMLFLNFYVGAYRRTKSEKHLHGN